MCKKLAKYVAMSSILVTLAGCNLGSSNNPTISASVSTSSGTHTSSSCTGMTTGTTCVIDITYNTNNATGVTLGYNSSPSPLPTSITNGTFNTSLGVCQSAVGTTTGQTTCGVTVTYTSAGGSGTNATINFTLGSATANTITLQGN